MAESYRGLTIRIGGDTTKLQQALRTSNSAISQTQQELRKLSQALKLDPDSIEAYSLQVGFLANQAANTAMKLSQLNDAKRQLEETKVRVGFQTDDDGNLESVKMQLKEIVEEAKRLDGLGENDVLNGAQKAASSAAEVRILTENLAKAHNEVTKLVSDAAKLESAKFSKAFDLSDGKKSVQEVESELRKLFSNLGEAGFADVARQVLDIKDAFDFENVFDFSKGTVDVTEIREQLDRIPESMRPSEDEIDAFVAKIEKMRDSYTKVEEELRKVEERRKAALESNDGKENSVTRNYDRQIERLGDKLSSTLGDIRSQYADAIAELTTLSGEVFNFDSENTDPEHLRESLEAIKDELGISDQQLDDFIGDVTRLRDEFRQADTDLKKWKIVEEFQDLVVEITRGEASLANFSKVLADMKVPSNVAKEMSAISANSKVLEEAYGQLMSSGRSNEAVLEADPDNIVAMKAATDSYSAAALVALENSSRLREEIEGFEGSGLVELGSDAESATQRLFDASAAVEETSRDLADIEGKYAAVSTRIRELESVQKASITDGKATAEMWKANREEIIELTARQEEYKNQLSGAREAANNANANLETAKVQKEYEDLKAKVTAYEKSVLDAYDAQMKLSKAEAVSGSMGDISQIDNLGEQLKVAADRAKILQTAVKLDPSNTELMAAKTQALADVENLVQQRTEAIKSAMASVPTDRLESMRSQYGTISNAVKATTDATKTYKMQLDTAKSALADMVRSAKFDDVRKAVLDTGTALDSSVIEKLGESKDDVIELRDAIATLGTAFQNASSNMDLASVFAAYEDMPRKLAESLSAADTNSKLVDDAAFQQALGRMAQYARQAAQEIVQSANTIDAAYRDMRKTVNATESDFQALRDEAIKFSQTHITSADTLLEMEALGGQLGIASGALAEFGQVAANLDISTDIPAEDIALQLGQIKNVMSDMDDTTFTSFADALVRLGNTTATTESNIMNVAQRMSSVANVTSMTTPQLLAWSAAIASTGQRSESAATAINNTITGIGKAVAAGGYTLKQFAAIAGMTADQFREAWANSSSDALEAFVKGLGSLTDDSTAAIEALDAVGISSVRQETALLGLSQTVENLDEAMNNAADAWNGGGDAAREAAQKSEGFSGALGIMQNNASNLAASLGDGLVPAMKVISSALQIVTDLLNSLPGPMKSAIVTVGGLGTAFATVYPMVQQLKKGWGEMVAEMSATPGAVNTMKSAIVDAGHALATIFDALKEMPGLMVEAATSGAGLTGVLEAMGIGASSAAAGFTALMTAVWPLLAVTAVVAAVGAVVDKFNEWREHVSLVEDANRSLVSTLDEAGSAYENYSEKLRLSSRTAEEVKEAHEEFLQSQADFTDSMREIWEKVGTDSATVDHYAETIKELAGACEGSEWSLSRLKEAVNGYNSITGSSIQIINDTTGELNILESALDATTEAYKRNAEVQAYIDMYEEAVKKRVEAQVELQKANEEYADNQERINELEEGGIGATIEHHYEIAKLTSANQELSDSMEETSETLEQRKDDEEFLKGVMEEQTKAHEDAASSIADYSSALASAGMDTSEFSSLTDEEKQRINEIQAALIAAGDSLTNYGTLNASQLSQIAAAWNNKVPDIVAAINKIKSAASDANGAASVKPDDSAVREYRNQQEAAYTQAKRDLDDHYSYEKKIRDDAYSSEKSRLDKEYQAHKDTLDKEYSARKSELDREYSEAKKASDKYLKDYKAALDKQVSDHKSATESKLKDVEREYEAKKKLLELEYKTYDDQLSGRIQAIKDEQAAEDEAYKQQERQDKLAELGKAVETARTNKARKDAEKALSDYKAQLAREDVKAQRDAQIDALEQQRSNLKDQLSDRQSHLKDSYDSAVAEYKAERDAELELLKSANEAKYEQEKELETSKLEMRKSANDATLQMIKDTNEAELSMHKESNENYLNGLKERNESELLAIKRANEDKLSELKNQQERELAAYKDGGQAAVDALNGIKNEAEATSESVKTSMSSMQESTTRSVEEIAKALLDNGQISLQTYLGIMNQMPGSMQSIFDEMGLTVDTGLGDVAKRMLASGDISLQQYLGVMNQMPGSTRFICNETGIAIADELGLFNEPVANAATNLKGSVTGPMSTLPQEVKSKSDEAGNAASSLGGQEAINNASKNSDNLAKSVFNPWKNIDSDAEKVGGSLPIALTNGINKDSDKPVNAAANVRDSTAKTLDMTDSTQKLGGNAAVGWNNGFVEWANKALENVRIWAQNVLSTVQSAHQMHSPSRKFAWLAEMALKGYSQGWELAESGTLRMVQRTSDDIIDSFGNQGLSTDFMQDLLDQMRGYEGALKTQASRMREVIEEAFDPRLSIDAAYEAMERISNGELKRQQTIAASSTQNNDNRQFQITVSIPEVVVREEADIDRLSQQIALRVQRSVNARIG